jgi:hypothetical protein
MDDHPPVPTSLADDHCDSILCIQNLIIGLYVLSAMSQTHQHVPPLSGYTIVVQEIVLIP